MPEQADDLQEYQVDFVHGSALNAVSVDRARMNTVEWVFVLESAYRA
jgi:hypothetical protein